MTDGRIAAGLHSGYKAPTLGTVAAGSPTGDTCATRFSGFSLHTGSYRIAVAGNDRYLTTTRPIERVHHATAIFARLQAIPITGLFRLFANQATTKKRIPLSIPFFMNYTE